MSPVEFGVTFGLGLASSVHCLGMCGPVVMAYSVGLRGPRLTAHLAYNGGRILIYMLLGAVAGGVGRGVGMLGQLAGLASGARILAGTAMIVAGALMIARVKGKPLVQIRTKSASRMILGARARDKFALGLMLGFLPCGLIYAALLKALDSAGAVAGALTMLAFGSGTAAALLATGMASSLAGPRIGQWANRVAAIAVVVFGAILLWRGLAARPVCHG